MSRVIGVHIADLTEGLFEGLVGRSSDTDSRSNSSVGGDGSSSTGTAALRKRGFSRLKVFGAMKVIFSCIHVST